MPAYSVKLRGLVLASLLLSAAPAFAQAPAYEIVSRGPGGLELRFHNMPMKSVHADDSQNALAIDFAGQVDGSAFDHLQSDFPDWISLAYASFDSGVVKSPRPVTFLTRQEADGFSLRIVPRLAPAPPGPVALRGSAEVPPPPPPELPPPPAGGYGPMRNYASLELALRRGDTTFETLDQRSAREGNSSFSLGSEAHLYRGGDRIIASKMHMRIGVGGGLSLIGTVYDTDSSADRVRERNGTFAVSKTDNLISGAGGFQLDTWQNTAFTLEALQGNDITGVRFTAFTGDPDEFLNLRLSWHDSDRDTPEAIRSGGLKDEAVIAAAYHLGWGFWANVAGRFTNYGVHGNASVAKTAGWDAGARWALNTGPVILGLAYDGRGEYLVDHRSFLGDPPSPYVPLGIRNMETHAVTGSLSNLLLSDTLWFDLYGGYITDRYTSNGGIYGAALRFEPVPGFNIALGARHSNVSLMQGEFGPETSAGLTFTLGFDSPSLSDYF